MHILESYATSCGLKIDKPFIFEKFFPIPFDKYITLHGFAKFNSRRYDYWEEVLDFISPVLGDHGINILQVGGKEEPKLHNCINLNGQTNINQLAYVVRRSLLHVGIDSFPIHLASAYTKILGLYPNMFKEHSKPYWSKEEDVLLIEPDRNGHKPSYSANENPKVINNIKPEYIANKIFEMLGLKERINLTTILRGPNFNKINIEMIPNSVIEINGIDTLLVRMDLYHNEQFLLEQLKRTKCNIVTKNPINIDILKSFKGKIEQIVYFIDENNDPLFVKSLQKIGLNCVLISEMSKEEVDKKKFDYLDFGFISQKLSPNPTDIEKIKEIGVQNLVYKSNKFLISEGKIYPSVAAWKKNAPISSLRPEYCGVIDSEEFWRDMENFYIFKVD
jgi:hypothetical protein